MKENMKKLIVLLVMTAGFSVHAMEGIETSVLELLISKASEITLVDSESGTALEEGQQLPEIVASSLMGGYLSAQTKKSITLKDVSVKCVDVTPKGLVGAAQHKCSVSFIDGTFKVSKSGSQLVGPETESAMIIEVEVSTAVAPHAKPSLKSKTLKTSIAG
jgi:hypothetical protein